MSAAILENGLFVALHSDGALLLWDLHTSRCMGFISAPLPLSVDNRSGGCRFSYDGQFVALLKPSVQGINARGGEVLVQCSSSEITVHSLQRKSSASVAY